MHTLYPLRHAKSSWSELYALSERPSAVSASISRSQSSADGSFDSRRRHLGRELARRPDRPLDGDAARSSRDRIVSTVSSTSTSLALSVVFVMPVKPSLGASLLALAVGNATGATLATALGRSRPGARASESARLAER